MGAMSDGAWLKKWGFVFRKEKTHGYLKIVPRPEKVSSCWKLLRETDLVQFKENISETIPVLKPNELLHHVMNFASSGHLQPEIGGLTIIFQEECLFWTGGWNKSHNLTLQNSVIFMLL